jgi:hypothetical protein
MPRDISEQLGEIADSEKEAAKALEELQSALEKASNTADRAFSPAMLQVSRNINSLTKSTAKYRGETARLLAPNKAVATSIFDIQKASKNAEKEVGNLSVGYKKSGSRAVGASKANVSFASTVDEARKELGLATKGLDSQQKALERAKRATSSFGDEVEEAASVLGLLRKKADDVEDEFKRYGDGIGDSATGMFAAGLAAVFLADKISELGDSVLDTIKSFRQYDISAAILAKASVVAPGGLRQLEQYRKELSLTREQALEYFKVLKEGAESGVVSVAALRSAAMRLQETFGDDPTARLREYVDILKEIPSLDVDLAITASLDDQAASWFALAKKGKIAQVIELQMAGLLGGIEAEVPPEGTEAQVETLTEMMKMNRRLEDFQFGLTNMIGPWGPQIVTIAKVGLTSVATLGGIFTVALGSKRILSRILRTNRGILAARTGIRGIPMSDVTIRGAFREGFSMFTRQLKMLGGRGITGLPALRGATRAVGTRLGTLAGAGAGGVVGSRLIAATGTAIKTLASPVSALTASLGALGGAVVTATGVIAAAVGPVILIGKYGERAGNQMKRLSRGIKGTNLAKVLNTMALMIPTFLALRAAGVKATDAVAWLGERIRVAGAAWQEWYEWAKRWLLIRDDLSSKEAMAAKEHARLISIQRRAHASAKALQVAISKTDRAFESAAVMLHDMSVEVAGLELENLRLVGGDVEDFRDALDSGVDGAKKSFRKLNEGLARARKFILTNANLDAQSRRAALLNLHKAELQATKKFMEAMLDLAGKFGEIPENVRAELISKIRELRMDVEVEAGIFGFKPLTDTVLNARSALSRLTNAIEHLVEAEKMQLTAEKEEMSERTRSVREFVDSLDRTMKKAEKSLLVPFVTVGGRVEVERDIGEEIFGDIRPADILAQLKATVTIDERGVKIDDRRILTKLRKQTKELMDKIAKALVNVPEADKATRAALMEQERILQSTLTTIDNVTRITASENFLLEARRKNMESIAGIAKDFISQIQKISEDVDKNPQIILLQKQLQQAENQAKLAVSLGVESGELLKEFRDRTKLLTAQLNAANAAKRELEKMRTDQKVLPELFRKTIKETKEGFDVLIEGARGIKPVDIGVVRMSAKEYMRAQKEYSDALKAGDIPAMQMASDRFKKAAANFEKDLLDARRAADKAGKVDFVRSIDSYIQAVMGGAGIVGKAGESIIRGSIDLRNRMGELAIQMEENRRQLDEQIATYREVPTIEAAEAVQGAADSLADVAEFSGNAKLAVRALNDQVDALNKTYSEEINVLKQRELSVLEGLKEQRKLAKTIQNDNLRNIELEKINIDERRIRAKIEKEENELALKRAKGIAEAIKRAADTRILMVDMEQGLIEEEISFLEEMGGSYGAILDMQKQSVAYEAQKLQVAEEALKNAQAAGVQGKELRQFEINAARQRMELTKKAMGAQRSTYEKLLELAFGAIRQARGARRGLMGGAMMFGRGRVMGRAGMVVAGRAMPIATRAAMMMGAAGLPGGAPAPGVLGARPTRMPVLGRLAGAMGRGGAVIPPGAPVAPAPLAGVAPPRMAPGVPVERPGRVPAPPPVRPAFQVEGELKANIKVEFDDEMFREKLIHITTTDVRVKDAFASEMEKQRFLRESI